MNPPGDVLGVTYFGPVSGSPLIPPEILTLYVVIFLGILGLAYLILKFKGQEMGVRQRLKKVFWLGVIIKLFVLVSVGGLAAYWFIPTPNVVKTQPAATSKLVSPNQKIVITFDRPVSRKTMDKKITPETPGVWIFENNFYTTHLYKSVTFYPSQSLKSDTDYQITLSDVKNSAGISEGFNYQFSFKTQPDPKVLRVEPKNEAVDVATDSVVKVVLNSPNDNLSEFNFELEPKIPFDISLDKTKQIYSLKTKENFKQGTKYALKVNKTDITINPQTTEIISRGETTQDFASSFTTKSPPGIEVATPTGTGVTLSSPIKVKFSTPMNRKSVEEHFKIEPKIEGKLTWSDDQNLEFSPEQLSYDTTYKITVGKGTVSLDGGFFEQPSSFQFTTIGSVKLLSVNPASGLTGITVTSPIKLTFDQAVDKPSAQNSFSVSPTLTGNFSWDKNTLIFTPSQKLSPSTTYTITLAAGIKGTYGLPSKQIFTSTFSTEQEVIKLAVPAFLQQHTLSCELSALRMALSFRGINVSEETLLSQVGVDNTPHQGNIWGNPNQAFVGNVDGNQMKDGYGVHWSPIARVAQSYRGAKEFSGWSINQLTETLAAGNPVVIWVYSSGGWPTSWNTPAGENIFALRDEHAVVAVGFVGKADNPTQIVINDPLHGQVFWSRALFDSKWGSFGRSGVVVF